MRRPVVLALLPLTLFAATAAADEGDIGYPSVDAARKALTARDDVRFSSAEGWLTVEDAQAMTIWNFAPESDPAHPAVVKRSVVEEDGRIVLRMDIRCEGNAEACDALEAHFLSLNQAAVEEMRGGSQDQADPDAHP